MIPSVHSYVQQQPILHHMNDSSHTRRSYNGCSLPGWLSHPDPVFLRNHVHAKYEPIIQEIELIEANPDYTHIKLPDG